MSSTGSGYDQASNMYSPDGRIFQVEYAAKAVENSGTAIGIRCADGIVLGVEKLLLSKMLVPGSNRRIFSVDKHAGIAMSGVGPDGRQIVNRAQSECENYRSNFGGDLPPEGLTDRISQVMHFYTLHGSLRPYGVSVLIAAYDQDRKDYQLSMVEPSGVSYRYRAIAVGKGRQTGKTEVEKLPSSVTCREAIKEIAKILHTLHDDGKDKPFELEMSWLCEESKWQHEMVPKHIVDEAEVWAKQKIQELEDMDDDDDDL